MIYRDQNKKWHNLESDILNMDFEHEHPLVKQEIQKEIKVWCPICDIVFGVILK